MVFFSSFLHCFFCLTDVVEFSDRFHKSHFGFYYPLFDMHNNLGDIQIPSKLL